jgi:hypothetical protein
MWGPYSCENEKNATAWVTFVFALYFQSNKLSGVKWQVFAEFFVGFPIWDGAGMD